MKAQIHPKWFEDVTVTCACGNTFVTASTINKYQVEICAKCHPFYTGQMKFVDTAGRVDAFMSRMKKASSKVISKSEKRRIKKEKKIQKELERPETLTELRKQTKKKNNSK
ncbi:MAG: 50S ribosomal protein L31 [Patescibacteria group bacterium]|nr:50S ribosomal protein L31 [Patescibacteria group bacterium]